MHLFASLQKFTCFMGLCLAPCKFPRPGIRHHCWDLVRGTACFCEWEVGECGREHPEATFLGKRTGGSWGYANCLKLRMPGSPFSESPWGTVTTVKARSFLAAVSSVLLQWQEWRCHLVQDVHWGHLFEITGYLRAKACPICVVSRINTMNDELHWVNAFAILIVLSWFSYYHYTRKFCFYFLLRVSCFFFLSQVFSLEGSRNHWSFASSLFLVFACPFLFFLLFSDYKSELVLRAVDGWSEACWRRQNPHSLHSAWGGSSPAVSTDESVLVQIDFVKLKISIMSSAI